MSVRTKIVLITACFVALIFLAAAPPHPSASSPAPPRCASVPVPLPAVAPPAPSPAPATLAVQAYEMAVEAARSGEGEEEGVREHEGFAPRADANVFYFGASGSWLGVTIADIDQKRADELGLREVAGAEVQAVLPESPAEKAGLQKGDVILSFRKTAVEGVAQLTRLVRETPAGRKVRLEVFRDGSTQTLEAEIEEGSARHEFHKIVRKIEIPHIEIPEIHVPDLDIDLPHINILGSVHGTVLLGVAVEALNDQLREFFGVEGKGGVLVRSVKAESAAAEAGVRAGDVILSIDDQKIDGPGTLHRALRDRKGRTIEVVVMRERRERTLTATLPEESSDSMDQRWEWKSEPREETKRIHERIDRIRSLQHHLRGEQQRLRELERRMRRQNDMMQRYRERVERERRRNLLRRAWGADATVAI